MTKGFLQWLEEEGSDQLGLHGKVVPVSTDHFEGHAHISFDRIKRGKHQQHSYRVDYKGKGGHPKHGGKINDHHEMHFMDVDHDRGRPYKYRVHPHSSKDLHTLIHKAAPRWVSLEDLKPRPTNEETEHPLNAKIRGALRGPFERHNGEEVKGATLGDIKDHLEFHHGIKMGTRRIDDHIYNHMRHELQDEHGHSRSGWSRGGLNKRTPARFFHKGEKYEWSEDSKKHIKGSDTYIRNKPANESFESHEISNTVYHSGGHHMDIGDHLEKEGHDVASSRPGRLYVRSHSQEHLAKSLASAKKKGLAHNFKTENGFRV